MTLWEGIDSDLNPAPAFPCQPPDGKRDWTELQRQATLLRLVRAAGPKILAYANANAGKRNPMQARREGIMAGVFDLSFNAATPFMTAHVELKGYSAAGRAGVLSPAQVEWGNKMHALGKPVACFFDPYEALDWLRLLGFPLVRTRIAA